MLDSLNSNSFFALQLHNDRITLSCGEPVEFPRHLHLVLGFETNTVTNGTVGIQKPDLNYHTRLFFMNADFIKVQQHNSMRTPFFCIIPAEQGQQQGTSITVDISTPNYLPISKHFMSEITFNITDLLNQPVKFNGGCIYFEIQFRKNH